MSEAIPSWPAEAAKRSEPPLEPLQSESLLGVLVGLTKALEAQTQRMLELTDSLANLCDHLASLTDQLEAQDDEQFGTLS